MTVVPIPHKGIFFFVIINVVTIFICSSNSRECCLFEFFTKIFREFILLYIIHCICENENCGRYKSEMISLEAKNRVGSNVDAVGAIISANRFVSSNYEFNFFNERNVGRFIQTNYLVIISSEFNKFILCSNNK